MTDSLTTATSKKSISDTVIDGLFAGLAAGAGMSVFLGLAGLVIDEMPADIFGRFSPGSMGAPLSGLLLHLAVSAIYGAVFGVLTHLLPSSLRLRTPGWLAGLAYGAVLLGLALGVVLPGLQSPLAELPFWVLALGHACYGFVLGIRAYPKW